MAAKAAPQTNPAKADVSEVTEQGHKKVHIDVSRYDHLTTVSAKIRQMAKDGYKRADIARSLGKKYQHVRNVLETPLKRQARRISKLPDSPVAEATKAKLATKSLGTTGA